MYWGRAFSAFSQSSSITRSQYEYEVDVHKYQNIATFYSFDRDRNGDKDSRTDNSIGGAE